MLRGLVGDARDVEDARDVGDARDAKDAQRSKKKFEISIGIEHFERE